MESRIFERSITAAAGSSLFISIHSISVWLCLHRLPANFFFLEVWVFFAQFIPKSDGRWKVETMNIFHHIATCLKGNFLENRKISISCFQFYLISISHKIMYVTQKGNKSSWTCYVNDHGKQIKPNFVKGTFKNWLIAIIVRHNNTLLHFVQ